MKQERSDDKQTWDFYGGDADKILNHAEYFTATKKGRLEYLKWALECIRGSARYVLRDQIDAKEKAKDAEEYLRDPERFERRNRYIAVDDPAETIQAEIDRLEGKADKPRKIQGVNLAYLRKFQGDPGHPHSCAILRDQLNVSKNAWGDWKTKGKKIAPGRSMREWQDLGYDSYGKSLLLKTEGRQVKQKCIWDFLRFTGEID